MSKFQYTLLFMAVAGGMFMLSCLLRFVLRVVKSSRKQQKYLQRKEQRQQRKLARTASHSGGAKGALAAKDEEEEEEDEAEWAEEEEEEVEGASGGGKKAADVPEPTGCCAPVRRMWRSIHAVHLTDLKQRTQHSFLILLWIFVSRTSSSILLQA